MRAVWSTSLALAKYLFSILITYKPLCTVFQKKYTTRLTCMFYNLSLLGRQGYFHKIRTCFQDVFYPLASNAGSVIAQARGENLRWGWPARAEINRQGHFGGSWEIIKMERNGVAVAHHGLI